MALGRVLKNIRVARGLSREAVAGTEYSVSHLAAVEQGVKRPSIRMLIHVADKLRVSLEMLVPEVMEHNIPVPEKIRLARALCREAKYDLAMNILTEARDEDESGGGQYRVDRLDTEAYVECLRGNYERAIDLYSKVGRIRERGGNSYLTAQAYYGLGEVEMKRGRFERASHWLFLAWDRLGPEAAEHTDFAVTILKCYASVQIQMGRVIQAQELYEMAARYVDGDTDVLVGMGRSLRLQGKYEESLGYLKQAQRHAPASGDTDLMTEMAINLRLSGRASEAIPLLDQAYTAAKRSPNNPLPVINEMIACLLDIDDTRMEDIDKWQGLITEDLKGNASALERARCLYLEARILYLRGRRSEALGMAREAFEAASSESRQLGAEILASTLRMARNSSDGIDVMDWAADNLVAVSN